MAQTKSADIADPELVAEICSRLAAGETTRAICRSYGNSLERQFWGRMQKDPEFAATIATSRLAGQDALTAETIDIADEATEENVQSARLRIWARQWYASKLAPKKYGDKVEQTQIHEIGDTLKAEIARIRSENGAGDRAGTG